MAGEVKSSPRRAYHSPLRADQAQQTRRRVLASAMQLFVDNGYAGTTVAAVAEHAGVSPETIYLSLGGKRGLLEGVIDEAITGPDNSNKDDKWWATIEQLPGASQRLAKLVEFSCRILARTRPIHAVIRGAADKEVFAAALERRLLQERLAAQTDRIRRYLGGELKPGLSVAEAGECYCALTSPELYQLLTVDLSWTAERHKRWLTRLLQTELLGTDDDQPAVRGQRQSRPRQR
jgi:AcrR family transcriptional regulator